MKPTAYSFEKPSSLSSWRSLTTLGRYASAIGGNEG